MPLFLNATLLLALLAAAWSAGFFWTWSFSVMPGFGAAPAETAITAMRAVNEGIRTAGFAFVFFGPAVFAAIAALLAAFAGRPGVATMTGAAALLYAAGVIGITFAFNLPLNDSLAAAVVTPSTAASVWTDYAVPWTRWNHLRTAAATLTLALLGAAALRAAQS